MKRLASLVFAAAVVATAAISSAQSAAKIALPNQMKWTPNQPKGTYLSQIAGPSNQDAPGYFIVRVKMSPGTHFQPHTHKTTEVLDVISGTLQVGFGKTVSMSNTKAVPAGGVVVIPAGVPHYTMASEAVVYDVSGTGPSRNIPVK